MLSKITFSKATTAGLIVLFSILIFFNLPNNILSWDVFGYYLYLPATFIHGDPLLKDFSPIQEAIDTYKSVPTFYLGYPTETGNTLLKTPMGFSVLFTPFFWIGHFFADWLGYPKDGFSRPYQYAILFGHWFYVVMGLLSLRKTLLLFFKDKLVAVLLLLLFFGTNYYSIILEMPAMPHGYLFLFYSLTISLTVRWHKSPSVKTGVLLGLVMGIAALARASEVLAILIPLFWNVTGRAALKEKIAFLKSNRKAFLAVIATYILCGLPQLIYWKLVSGHFFVDSYQNPGEGFDLTHPHTLDFLFSYRKGWFVYTPLMLFATAGFYFLWKKKEQFGNALIIFFVINLFILSSWTCWWYAESFGMRSMVQSYPIMLIPLGYFIMAVFDKISVKSIITGLVFAICIFLNLFQSWQARNGILHYSRMTGEAYWASFLATERIPNLDELLLIDKSIPAEEHMKRLDKYDRITMGEEGFESCDGCVSEVVHSGENAFLLTSDRIYSPDIRIPYEEITDKDHCLIKVSMWVYSEGEFLDTKPSIVAKFLHGDKAYHHKVAEVENSYSHHQPGEWFHIELNVHTPTVRHWKDELQVFGWLRGQGKVYIDDLKVEVFVPKN